MSRKLVTLIYERRIGSMLRKAVLSCMADRANDDGSGVWMSKGRIAEEIEASRRAVITCIQAFVDEGILIDHGKKFNRSTHEYTLVVKAILALPRSQLRGVKNCTPDTEMGVQICTEGVNPVHTGCEPSSHEPPLNRPLKKEGSETDEGLLARRQSLSAMRAQALASPLAMEVLADLLDLHKRGRISLRDIDRFKGAVRGVSGDELILAGAYTPPPAIAAVLGEPEPPTA